MATAKVDDVVEAARIANHHVTSQDDKQDNKSLSSASSVSSSVLPSSIDAQPSQIKAKRSRSGSPGSKLRERSRSRSRSPIRRPVNYGKTLLVYTNSFGSQYFDMLSKDVPSWAGKGPGARWVAGVGTADPKLEQLFRSMNQIFNQTIFEGYDRTINLNG